MTEGFIVKEFSSIGPEPLILFHGSPKGIVGSIRVDWQGGEGNYDFGKGFYTAEKLDSAMNVLVPFPPCAYEKNPPEDCEPKLPDDYEDPYFYTLEFNASHFTGARIYSYAWALFVAYNWKMIDDGACPEFYDSVAGFMENIDIVSGPISDDKTYMVMELFLNGNMTFECMNAVLRSANTGMQYVFKSQKLADRIKIISMDRLDKNACKSFAEETAIRKAAQKMKENKIIRQYRRDGLMLDELIEKINRERIVFPKMGKHISMICFKP